MKSGRLHDDHDDFPPECADKIAVGDLYEDCSYEPLLCILADYDEDELLGISLVNGRMGWCSPTHCGVRKLPLAEAVQIRAAWPPPHIVEFAQTHGLDLRISSETVPAARVRPGQGGLEPVILDRVLNRISETGETHES
jgi:hypothetical protein